jgi:hypothetical protein
MDLPAYTAFFFQNQTSSFIMPLNRHIRFHFKVLASNFQLPEPAAPGAIGREGARLSLGRKTSITQSCGVEYLNMNLKWYKWKAETETNRANPPTVAGKPLRETLHNMTSQALYQGKIAAGQRLRGTT